MTDEIYGLINDAKKKKFSYIGPNIGDEDVISVWDGVASYIRKNMDLMKGVCIGGLGTFTFSQKRLDVGGNKFLQIQRPVFVLSDRFSMKHNLHIPKQHVSGNFPVVQLNYSAISLESPFDRDTVEACVKEVLLALDRSISAGRNIEFVFNGIGRLQMREGKVKMRFYKDFLNNMDGTGHLVNSLKDRPGTVDSVMSDRPPTRPYSNNTMLLPRIIPALVAGPSNGMPTIAEGEGEGDHVPNETERTTFREGDEEGNMERGVFSDMKHDDHYDVQPEPDHTEDEKLFEVTPPPPVSNSRMSNRVAVPIPRAVGVSFNDELLHSELHTPRIFSRAASVTSSLNKPISSPQFNKHPLSAFSSNHFKSGPMVDDPRPRSQGSVDFDRIWKMTPLEKISPFPGEEGIQREPHLAGFEPFSTQATAGQSKQVEFPMDTDHQPPVEVMSARASSCGHANSGQELCYLCHQREKRNIPVFLAEERRAQEQKEDQLLQQFQSIVDADAILKEQEKFMEKKRESQKMAAFNLGVAEAVHTKKNTVDPFHTSFIFPKRPRTPPKYVKQERYFKDLEVQVNSKQDVEKQQKSDEDFLGRLEQVQLAEELAAQRDQYMRNKMDQQNMYRRALSAQLKFKPLPLPARVSDSGEPVFGKDDMANEKLAMKRRRAREIYQQQMSTVEQQKRENLLRRLNVQKEEEDVLKRTREELQDDRARKHALHLRYREKLQEDWARATAAKHATEASEHARILTPGGLLHEQCDQYKRCGQCKRRTDNCGETNLWKESRYIAGSRLIV